jgi:hypothetical protein
MQYHYEYFGPQGARRSTTLDSDTVSKIVGDRVLMGWEVTTRWFADPDGEYFWLTYFQSDITGNVWCLLYPADEPTE